MEAQTQQLCTFFVDGRFFGVDVTRVQEVIRHQEMTRVPLAPHAIRGLINLRGQIVTAGLTRCGAMNAATGPAICFRATTGSALTTEKPPAGTAQPGSPQQGPAPLQAPTPTVHNPFLGDAPAQPTPVQPAQR